MWMKKYSTKRRSKGRRRRDTGFAFAPPLGTKVPSLYTVRNILQTVENASLMANSRVKNCYRNQADHWGTDRSLQLWWKIYLRKNNGSKAGCQG
jgi:hypothetical protein